ncbi:hypothetical protein FWH09_00530 [Candidatus Saccharibacteria bacterium]|nr:hypothetical protein [Candidatus Saccharibacteria bacterium]
MPTSRGFVVEAGQELARESRLFITRMETHMPILVFVGWLLDLIAKRPVVYCRVAHITERFYFW